MSGKSLFVSQGYLLDINLSACAYKCEATRSVFAGRVAFGVKANLFLRNSHIPCAFTPLSLYADPHGGADAVIGIGSISGIYI